MSRATLNKNLALAWELASEFRKPDRQAGRTATAIRELRKSSVARGQCIDRSSEFNKTFRKTARKSGRKLRIKDWSQRHWYSVLSTKAGSEPVVIDFTYRQFDHKSPWPLVEPLAAYKERLHSLRY